MVEMRCDFCMEQGPWVREVHSSALLTGKIEDVPFIDDGVWLTCPTCGHLIDLHKTDELLDRAVTATLNLHNDIEDTSENRRVLRERLHIILSAVLGDEVGTRNAV